MYNFTPISDYIEFLKQQFKLYISLHPIKENENIITASQLMVFNFHTNSYCTYIKRNEKAALHCRECQKRVTEKCKNGSFNGVCFAGVKERVYPIKNGNEVVGFISVSGYKTENFISYINRISKKYNIKKADLSKNYGQLNNLFPSDKELDTLIIPLCQMLELSYQKYPASPTTFTDKVVQYIRQNRNSPITSKDICKKFYCSRSFMSTQFNKATGKSIREYINELRIADSKSLLKESSLSVTEIAFLTGFGNSNYFSKIFKEQTGLSPIKYRKAP